MPSKPVVPRPLPSRPYERGRQLRFLLRLPLVAWTATIICLGVWILSRWATPNGAAFWSQSDNVLKMLILGPVVGLGFVSFVFAPAFVLRRRIRGSRTVSNAASGERVFAEVEAHHWMGDEPRPGTLVVTSTQLVFLPSQYAVQEFVLRIAVPDIVDVAWFDFQPIGPVSNVVVSTSAGEHHFILSRASEQAALVARLASARGDSQDG